MEKLLRKKPDENKFEYIWRIGRAIDNGLLPHWKNISEDINKELGLPEDEYLSESAYRKMYQSAKKFYDAGVFDTPTKEKSDLALLKRDIEHERVKLRTEKIEYNRWIREHARDELIVEKMIEAINGLQPLDTPQYIKPKKNNKGYMLAFGDEHFGVEFELLGIHGEVINAYSPEIFETHMWDLFNQLIEIINKEKIDLLYIYSLGDFCDGILRVSQLMKLRYGVIDSTIKYADFMCNWLNELSKYVRIEYQMTGGNHTELRMLNQPKGTFTEDNMSKFVFEFIKCRLKDNKNIEVNSNPTDFIYQNIVGFEVLGFHGEVKNMEQAMKDFSKIYNINVDYLIAGHLHHTKVEEVGKCSEVINVPSIIGIDPYSLSIRKTSDSAAKLIVFEESKGKVCEYTIKLQA